MTVYFFFNFIQYPVLFIFRKLVERVAGFAFFLCFINTYNSVLVILCKSRLRWSHVHIQKDQIVFELLLLALLPLVLYLLQIFCFRLGIWLIPVSGGIQEMRFWSLQVYFREDAIQFPLEKLQERNLRWLVANFLTWALKRKGVILWSLYLVILYCIRCFHLKILSRDA